MNFSPGLETSESTGLGIPPYDFVGVTNPTSSTVTYTFKQGGSSGTTVATVVVVYTDSTQQYLVSVTKT